MATQSRPLEADVLTHTGKCPLCGHIAKPRAKRGIPALTKDEKKTAQDVARCEAAIAVLERRIAMPSESDACKVAFADEIIRLSTALQFVHTDPYKLKRIFRRKET